MCVCVCVCVCMCVCMLHTNVFLTYIHSLHTSKTTLGPPYLCADQLPHLGGDIHGAGGNFRVIYLWTAGMMVTSVIKDRPF